MKFGFIGTGNMGGALCAAVCKAVGGENVGAADFFRDKAEAFCTENGCILSDNAELAANAEYLFLGVKPQMMADMLSGIGSVLAARKERIVLVSMAAGLSIDTIRTMAGGEYPVIRIMPNTSVRVGEGMIEYCACGVEPEEIETFVSAMRFAGRLDAIPENLIDAASAVAGCGPAFAYLFMEALADGAVECGLPRQKAQIYTAQMLLGAAKLVLESGEHTGKLKDDVCSPGGTTIAGVHALEDGAFRASVMNAVVRAYKRTLELSNK